jgi:hypothetical protein
VDQSFQRESNSSYFKKRENYIYLRYKDHSSVDIEEAKIHAKYLIDLCDGKRYPFILDGRDVHAKFSHDARNFFSNYKPLLNVRSAQAFLINNTPNRLLLKFYLKFHTPSNPVKVFSNLEDAEHWVSQFKVDLVVDK